jgi:cytochrome P450
MSDTRAVDYEPLGPEIQADPYPCYAALRTHAPVYFVNSMNAYAVSRYADVRRVLHDHHTFSNEAMAVLVSRPTEFAADAELLDHGDSASAAISIIGHDGDEHRRLRLIVNRAFTPRRLSGIETEMRARARGFVETLAARRGGDLQSGLSVPFPTIVIAELLGVDSRQRDDFRRWSEHMVRGVFEPLDSAEQAEVANAGAQMGDWLDEQIAARAGCDGDDVVSVLLEAEAGGGALTRDELQVFVFTLLVAGSITTAYLIGSAVHLLAKDPALLRALKDDASRVAAFVEETLRYETPTQLMFRTATVEVTIAETTIPRGATVLAVLGSANRDAAVFDRADTFDPSRDASEHLAFGHGPHFCLGAALARLEARVALEELVQRVDRIELAGDSEPVTSMVFRGPTRLPLTFA